MIFPTQPVCQSRPIFKAWQIHRTLSCIYQRTANRHASTLQAVLSVRVSADTNCIPMENLALVRYTRLEQSILLIIWDDIILGFLKEFSAWGPHITDLTGFLVDFQLTFTAELDFRFTHLVATDCRRSWW